MTMHSNAFNPDGQRPNQLTLDELIAKHWSGGWDPNDGCEFVRLEDLTDEQLNDPYDDLLEDDINIDGPEARALTFGYVIADNLQSDDERRQRAAEKRAVGVFRDREVLVRELRAALAINDSDERELHLLALADTFADIETGPDFSYPETETEPDGFQLGSAVTPLKPIVRI